MSAAPRRGAAASPGSALGIALGGASGAAVCAAVCAALAGACTGTGPVVTGGGGGGRGVGIGTDRAVVARSGPAARLERAILATGGVAALGRARALAWDGRATVRAGGRVVQIAGRWLVQPPDTAVVETYDVARGPATARALVVAAPRGWVVGADGRFAPMPPALLASERDEFALYDAMRLLPLRAARLAKAEPDSAGHPGLRAARPGRPDVTLWFGPDGRVAHLAAEVADAGGGPPARQDLWLEGAADAGGVRWPRRIRIFQRGAEFFDLTLGPARALPRAADARLAGPPAGAGGLR